MEIELATCDDIGRAVLIGSKDVQSSVAFHDLVQATYLPGLIDVRPIADSASSTIGSEQAIWTTILGLSTKVLQQDHLIQSLINRVILCDNANRASPNTIEYDLFECEFTEVCPGMVSPETPHFEKDTDLKALARLIIRNLQYPQALRISGHITGKGYWKYFVQGLFYKLLKKKEDICKLTYRVSGGRYENDGKVNVCSSPNWPVTAMITELIVHLMGKFDTAEKSEFMNHAAITIRDSLIEVRRSFDASRKRRSGTTGKEIDFFDSLVRDN